MHPESAQGLVVLVALTGAVYAVDSTTSPPMSATLPCVATSTAGAFFDLRPDIVALPVDGAKPAKGARTEDYQARGHDYGRNFTMNICSAVVKPPGDVVGVDQSLWKNVSAYYETSGRVYSLGLESSVIITRGRRLVLQYKNGSPCVGPSSTTRDTLYPEHHSVGGRDYMADLTPRAAADTTDRRKSTTISFLCDRDPLNTEASISFIGVDPDECAYFFEVRSSHACPGVEPHKPGSLGPGSVFAVMLVIAVLVYLVGGVFYQRTVAHARGWRQLPNYSLWAGIWLFWTDILTAATSSCARFLPRRRGYRSLAASPSAGLRSREDENRLIDQLDEEWDD